MRYRILLVMLLLGTGVFVGSEVVQAQMCSSIRCRPLAHNVIMPQARAYPIGRPAAITITGVDAKTVIDEQVATTVMDIHLHNPGHSRQEAELIVPVPDGAIVRGFTFKGSAKEPTAELLPADDARRIYDSIVASLKDPALLQFVGFNLIRSSVFPVEAHSAQQVRLTYESLLERDGERVDFVLPRSESLDYKLPWTVTVEIRSKAPISTVYSPTHLLTTDRKGPGKITASVDKGSKEQGGPFRLSYLLEKNGMSASMFAYPDPEVGGGYFLLLAGLPALPPDALRKKGIKREVTLVIDRSGSMSGEKWDQVRAAARQVIHGLDAGEAFNIIVYNEAVDPYSTIPIIKTRETASAAVGWLDDLNPSGGTNIHDALVEALRLRSLHGMLPIVLFMTDGLPTIGQTSEVAIRNVATTANKSKRRIFAFGVGVDVNTPLLEGIASATRATATFVMPQEDVELKVASVFRKLAGPVLADTTVALEDKKGRSARTRVSDVLPNPLPDLFMGDQLVLLGQYRKEQTLVFKVGGNYLGEEKSFSFTFDPSKATTRNGFVPRLWASRKIALLIDAIRQAGADITFAPDRERIAKDPRFKELVDEVVRLSTKFGILTEYTAFLAREGTDLSDNDDLNATANGNFVNRAVMVRSGYGSVNQSMNKASLANQVVLNPDNDFYDENMNRVEFKSVQQVNDRAFYRRGNRWVDSQLVEKQDAQPAREVDFGSEEFMDMARKLAKDGRQGTVALEGDILLEVDGESVLVRNR